MNNVDYLPIWKKGATPGERLEELALIARKHPGRFERFVICYVEMTDKEAGTLRIRTMQFGCNLAEGIGLYELGKVDAYNDSTRAGP